MEMIANEPTTCGCTRMVVETLEETMNCPDGVAVGAAHRALGSRVMV